MEIPLALMTLLVGWIANEFSHRLRTRDNWRQEYCRAISALLELRFVLRSTEEILRLVAEQTGLPHATVTQAFRAPCLKLMVTESTLQGYVRAVEAIAAHDPLLSYELTGRHRLNEFIGLFQTLTSQIPAELNTLVPPMQEFTGQAADLAANEAHKVLEHCTLLLARRTSIWMWWQLRRKFRQNEPHLDSSHPVFVQILKQIEELREKLGTVAHPASTGDAASARKNPASHESDKRDSAS